MNNCIFCKIAKKEISTEVLWESERVIAFKDIEPIAPTHILLVPKVHYKDLNELSKDPAAGAVMADILQGAREIAEKLHLGSYNLINNCGKEAGQSVFHVHFHLISGLDITGKLSQ